MNSRALTVGLLAHVDAGKTTLAEAMLFLSGRLRRLGRVDHRDAYLDTDAQERERGITIFSKQATLSWDDVGITLLDTPGHVDFSSEMERALSVLDAAVLVVSATSGIQAHTLTLWRLLRDNGIPTFLWINKMDQPGADRQALTAALKARLSDGCVDLQAADAFEQAALCDEDALTEYVGAHTLTKTRVRSLVAARKLFPCFFGSALKNEGVDALLSALTRYASTPVYPENFSARVYKISRDGDARLTHMKITGGCLRVRDIVRYDGREEKVGGIRLYSGAKFSAVEQAPAGMLCAVTGLSATYAGEGLGEASKARAPELEPVFSYRALPPKGCDPHTLLQKLKILEEEDPLLRVEWNENLREIHVQLMGEVQLEILKRLLLDRFSLDVSFGEGGILYRETVESAAIGVGHYEPLRHYAEVRLLLEPGERGSGLVFASACPEDELERSWQRLILTHLAEKRHPGVLTGAPITDMKITLLAGRAHLKHTEGGDFRQATYRAVRQGLMSAQSVLLEPWYDLRLDLPAECVGRAMTDIGQMGGTVSPPELIGDRALLTGAAPVSKARYYAREVAVYTRGRGQISCAPRGYAPAVDQERIVRDVGYDPERDIDNPADSVFCAHGAGFTVRWDEAPGFMHIPAERQYAEIAAAPARASRTSSYRGTAEEDEELLAIFERTYGAIKPQALRPTPKAPPPDTSAAIEEPPPECLLVDGYNIIFAWDELKAVAKESLAAARQDLMDILCNYRGFKPCELTLVFDAYKVPDHPGAVEEYKNITVVYTKEGETADHYIEKTVFAIGKRRRVRVATSDGLEQMMILGDGALRLSASELRAEVKAANVEIAAILRMNNRRPANSRAVETALREAMRRKKGQNEENNPQGTE